MPTDEQLRERENRLLLSLVARKRTLMTDEQLREQFEEVRGKGYPDYVNEHLFQRDEFDNYVLSDINSQWHGWRMAYRSRDAEVQALREELLNYVSADEMAVGEGYGTYPKSEHRRIRALVAGEEGSDND